MLLTNSSNSDRLTLAETSWEVLALRTARGDERALRVFFDRSRWLVSGLALVILHDSAEAEEVVADVYLQVWRQASRFDPSRGTAKAWLKTMTRSRAIDRLRRQTRRPHEIGLEPMAELEAGTKTPEGEMLFAQQARGLRAALCSLRIEQQEAIELAFWAGLSHTQVAKTLRLPVGTVKSRIRSGLSKLRDILKDAA